MTKKEAAHHSNQLKRFFNEQEAADFLNLSVKTLRRWRWEGKVHLPFRKFGAAVRYLEDDLIAFTDAALRASTSDTGGNAHADR